jgi:glutathione S-transferase
VTPPLLWQYTFSNFNEKARWALDFKQIPHRRRSLMPGGPRAMAFSRRDGTLPVLDLDGERIVDSTRIIEALERRFPERPLYPEDPAERRQALELEDFFDEHAGHDMRRVGFWELRDERTYGAEFLTLAWPPEYPYEIPKPLPSKFLDSLQDHPAVGWIGETYRRHRGVSAEVA